MVRAGLVRKERKAATRRALVVAAQTLFAEKGYDETTLEEVAELACLHVQTLYRHFASKVELVAAGDEEKLERFRLAIRDPDRKGDTFSFWRQWLHTAATRVTQEDGGQYYREFLIQRWGPPTVSSHLIRIGQAYEDLLAESLAKDFQQPLDGNGLETPRLAAIALWAANAHILRRHCAQEDFDLVCVDFTWCM